MGKDGIPIRMVVDTSGGPMLNYQQSNLSNLHQLKKLYV